MPKVKSRPARIATQSVARLPETGTVGQAGGEKTKEQLKEDLKKTKEELAIQKWGLEKTLREMSFLVKEVAKKKKETEEAKAKDEALLESIGDGVIATDLEGKIILMNQIAQEMLGWHPEDMVGRVIYDTVVIEDEKGNVVPREKRPTYFALAGTTTTTTGPTYNYVRKDKTKFPAATKVSPVFIDNKIIGVIEVFRDITKEREIDSEKSQFISIASHQLRTPLTSIQWVIERFVKKENLTPKGREYLDDIHMSAKRLTTLVDLLLNVSRIEAGRVGITPELTDVIGFVESYLQECAPLCDKKELQLVFKDHPAELVVKTDKSALRNIVQNIVGNAMEYSLRRGRVEITIQKNDDKFVIKVSDTGIGIPKAEQAHIFEKFTRASNGKLYKTDGTGIGLYLAQWAAGILGGKIWFESPTSVLKTSEGKEENKGSTFYIELPMESQAKEGEKPLA